MTETASTIRRKRIEEMPRVKFVWHWAYDVGPGWQTIGVVWSRKLDAEIGEHIYRHAILLRYCVKANWEWR